MATSQPQGHFLIVSDRVRRSPVRILVAAAMFTRRSREFNPGPIMEGATLLELRQAMMADKAMVAVCLP